jgi:hypothetical protein
LLAYSLNAVLGINFVYALCAVCFVVMAVVWRPFAARLPE